MAAATDMDARLDRLFCLFAVHGAADYVGEALSVEQHSRQCAWLAAQAQQPVPVVVAALLHDVGHLVGAEQKLDNMHDDKGTSLGTREHGRVGAQYLAGLGFGADVCDAVQAHEHAKRYLCAVDPLYYDSWRRLYNQLSWASKQTLQWQGGVMSPDQVAEFESAANHKVYLAIREWDEAAKDPLAEAVPDLAHFRLITRTYLLSL